MSASPDPVVILSAARTPLGRFMGELSPFSAHKLGAHVIINAGSAGIVLSGGMESMSNAPYLLAKARGGYRAGHDRIIDHMMMDGLEDAYETGRSMGDFGEAAAEAYQFTRKDQDAYAMETLNRARKAVEGGAFKAEIAPITLTAKASPR